MRRFWPIVLCHLSQSRDKVLSENWWVGMNLGKKSHNRSFDTKLLESRFDRVPDSLGKANSSGELC